MVLLVAFLWLADPTLLELGAKAREQGQLDRAVELYRKATESDPQSGEGWWYLGMCLYDMQRFEEAEAPFAALTRLHPERGAGWAMLGLTEYRNRKYAAALESLRTAHRIGLPPMQQLSRVVRYHLSVLLNHVGQPELASGLLMTFVAENAVTPLVKQAAGQAALRVPTIPEELPPDLREPVRLAGEASVLAWEKKLPEARAAASALIERYPAQPNARHLMGYLLLLDNDPAAISWFEKEIELDPNHVPARLQIAYERLRQGRAAEALPYASKAAELSPNSFLARDIFGRVLLDLGRTRAAVRELQAAVKLAPDNAEGHLHLATAYNRAGRKQDSARHRAIFQKLEQERK